MSATTLVRGAGMVMTVEEWVLNIFVTKSDTNYCPNKFVVTTLQIHFGERGWDGNDRRGVGSASWLK